MIDFDTKKFHINPNYRLQFEEVKSAMSYFIQKDWLN